MLIYLLFILTIFKYHIEAIWPSSNSSKIHLLGLFPDEKNTSKPTELSVHSHAMFRAAILLSQQYNITIEGQFIEWKSIQTGGNAIDGLSEICQIISNYNINGIIGPGFSRETSIIANFAEKINIPIISYSATNSELSDHNAYPNFYRTVPSDNAAALAIMKLFIRFNWTSCIIIYQNDAFGLGGAKIINEIFIKNDLTVINTIIFDIETLRIRGNLKNILIDCSTRIVIVWAIENYISLIINEGLDSDVIGPHFTWILSTSISLNSFNQSFYSKLIGILTIEPTTAMLMNRTLFNSAYNLWKQYEPETLPQLDNINQYGLFTFDATWLLIQSLQQYCLIFNNKNCLLFKNSSFCFYREFYNSNFLFNIINNLTFLGISGHIQFQINQTDRINGSYYYIQNIQTSTTGLNFVPVLNYSDYNGWKEYTETSVIFWPGNSLIPSTDIPQLNGVTLRICMVGSDPFTIRTSITNYTGYIPELISFLQNKLGFIPNIIIPSENQTRNQLIKAVADGFYDIMIGDITVTSSRRKIVSFSNSIFDTSTRIIMRDTSNVAIDLISFLKPFSRNLWLLILGAILFSSILFCFFERKNNEMLQNRSIISLSTMGIWYCFGTLTGCGADFHVTTAAGRLLTAGLYILNIVLLASYTANLASDLTLQKSKSMITGISDIKNGKLQYNRIGIIAGSSLEDYFLREISGGKRDFYPLQTVDDLFDKILNGIVDACFLDSGLAEYLTNNVYCNLTLIGESFDGGVFGIVTSKQWIYRQDLDVAILALREEGIIDDLISKWFQKKNCPDVTQTSTAMGIDSMGGLFFIFGIIVLLSIGLFTWTKRSFMKEHLFIFIQQRKN
ncbi:hypothetical protein I4U23_011178 [Adineta vaga]|nr:hypothetical protein I4U23_011178 [Adineta vaga]